MNNFYLFIAHWNFKFVFGLNVFPPDVKTETTQECHFLFLFSFY